MKRFQVVEIEYDKLRADLQQNCDTMIRRHNIKFNYDFERDEYVALVKMSKSPLRHSSPARVSRDFARSTQKRGARGRLGEARRRQRRLILPKTAHVDQSDFHRSCHLSFSKSRSQFKRLRSPVVYRPSHRRAQKGSARPQRSASPGAAQRVHFKRSAGPAKTQGKSPAKAQGKSPATSQKRRLSR